LVASVRSDSPPNTQTGCGPKTWRVIGFACGMPLTVYENVPSVLSVKTSIPEPTAVDTTCVGSNGVVLSGGPVVL
jgi:hypothetical protein